MGWLYPVGWSVGALALALWVSSGAPARGDEVAGLSATCDFDLDGSCGTVDAEVLLSCWGSTGPSCAHTDLNGDGVTSQSDYSLFVSLASAMPSSRSDGIAVPANVAIGTTIDVTLGVVETGTQITYVVGVEESSSGLAVPIGGYTLDYTYDSNELSFTSAQQLVPFGALGIIDFTGPNDCTNGRCTAGNILGVDSDAVGPLFQITFHIVAEIDDGAADFTAGVLDPVFDDITQPLGDPIFEKGIAVVSHGVGARIVPVLGPAGLASICLLITAAGWRLARRSHHA